MERELLVDKLCQLRMEENLVPALKRSPRYKAADADAVEKLDYALEVIQDEEYRSIVDDVIAAYNNASFEYGAVAYQQGFRDGVKFVYELYEICFWQE